MTDPKLDEKIREAAMDYNTPPETPRDRIWDGIQAKRHGSRRPRRATMVEVRRALWPIAAAALLVLGVYLGRLSVDPGAGEGPGQGRTEVAEIGEPVDGITDPADVGTAMSPDPSSGYRLAAASYLTRAEVLLTSFNQTSVAPESDERFSGWARGLLSDTRLLLDSPAAEDLELLVLLKDLELILARMVRLSEDESSSQHRWLTDELDDGSLLTRLRMQIPAGDSPDGA